MNRAFTERFEILPYPTASSIAGTAVDVAGLESLAVQVKSASPSLTITWQGSVDGVNFGSVQAVPLATGTAAATAANPADAALFFVDVSGLSKFRANITSYSSGSVGATALGLA